MEIHKKEIFYNKWYRGIQFSLDFHAQRDSKMFTSFDAAIRWVYDMFSLFGHIFLLDVCVKCLFELCIYTVL